MTARPEQLPTLTPGAVTKWAEIDLAALRDNVAAIRDHVGPRTAVMAMVKANGFGHGAVWAARAALAGGARGLGVSCAEEALQLRAAGIDAPVLVTGWSHPALLPELLGAGVETTVLDEPTLDAVLAAGRATGRTPAVHVKVDTGMVRLGVRPEQADELLRRLAGCARDLRIAGVFTHFADAEADAEFTAEQDARLLRFADALLQVAPDALVHAANSAATLSRPETWHDLVRPGIALYGYPPVADIPVALRPAMTVLAHVTQVRTVGPGETVGYGRTWQPQGRRRVATVAAGYADGVSRRLSNLGVVIVGERRCAIVGRVSMDQLTVDVTAVDRVREGDVACLFGPAGARLDSAGARLGAPAAGLDGSGTHLDAADVAAMIDSIVNEVLCAVPPRMPRIAVGPDAESIARAQDAPARADAMSLPGPAWDRRVRH